MSAAAQLGLSAFGSPVSVGLSAPLGLPTVGLAELDATAALQTRRDRKYALREANLGALLARGLAGACVLAIDGRTKIAVRTVYYDTAALVSYLGCAQRRRRRFKLRTRQRDTEPAAWLEVKTRGPRGFTVKDRVADLGWDGSWPSFAVGGDSSGERLGLETAGGIGDLPADQLAAALAALASRGVVPPAAADLRPCLEVRYRRTTYLLPDGQGRATVDTCLSWGRPGLLLAAAPGLAVVETKTAGPPAAFDRAAWSCGCRPLALSKFGVGMALAYPGLPDHRWRRLLRHLRPLAVQASDGPSRRELVAAPGLAHTSPPTRVSPAKSVSPFSAPTPVPLATLISSSTSVSSPRHAQTPRTS
ncbi:MAG: hypothetical protein LBI84_02440 [Propionibacteriaceae bacterium]|jgi:hypothetical protein|nr:hypothetical protein [Propionibacteriaceae bacterium]